LNIVEWNKSVQSKIAGKGQNELYEVINPLVDTKTATEASEDHVPESRECERECERFVNFVAQWQFSILRI
jgi:hypothetical protein